MARWSHSWSQRESHAAGRPEPSAAGTVVARLGDAAEEADVQTAQPSQQERTTERSRAMQHPIVIVGQDPRAVARWLSRLALAVAVQSLPLPGAFAAVALDGWGAMLQLMLPAPMNHHGRRLLRSAGRRLRRLQGGLSS